MIVSLCQHFGWDYVGVINGDTLEDFEAVRVFKNEAQDANITVAAVVNAASDSPEDMRELVNHMHTELEHVRIWVQFYPVSPGRYGPRSRLCTACHKLWREDACHESVLLD